MLRKALNSILILCSFLFTIAVAEVTHDHDHHHIEAYHECSVCFFYKSTNQNDLSFSDPSLLLRSPSLIDVIEFSHSITNYVFLKTFFKKGRAPPTLC
ncbi:MAG: hypothetical protein GY909_18370 [Oligoflexia bacterium]|nr:hypothetical protein [Oligoflexia bacterium]